MTCPWTHHDTKEPYRPRAKVNHMKGGAFPGMSSVGAAPTPCFHDQ